MLDVTKKIANLLEEIAHVELANSEAPLVMPSIYITQVSNTAAVRMDNKDFLTDFIYQLDISIAWSSVFMTVSSSVSGSQL